MRPNDECLMKGIISICIPLGAEYIRETKQLLLFTGYNLNAASLTGEQKTMVYHRLVEAFKFANGLKKDIHNPRFSSEEVSYF